MDLRKRLRSSCVGITPASQQAPEIRSADNDPVTNLNNRQTLETGTGRSNENGSSTSYKTDEPYTLLRRDGSISDWDFLLMNPAAVEWVCPVNFFPHAPFYSKWKDFAKLYAKIEIEHPQDVGDNRLPVYCVATILKFAGYKALVRCEGLDSLNSKTSLKFWISYCSSVPKPLGFALRNQHLLLPVNGEISPLAKNSRINSAESLKDIIKDYLIQEFSISDESISTISEDHSEVVESTLLTAHRPARVQHGHIVEVIDVECIRRNRLAYVQSVTGDRLSLKYMQQTEDHDKLTPDLCVNVKSEVIHPFGWSHTMGVELESFSGICPPNMPTLSKKRLPTVPRGIKIVEGMTFEVRHPVFVDKILPATVRKNLKCGYFVAQVLTPCPQDFSEFVIHIESDYVLPRGFCSTHNISFDEFNEFTWENYFGNNRTANATSLNLSFLRRKNPHNFQKGHKFEAVDALDTFYLGPATVLNVTEHLLFVQFDGWPRGAPGSSQWVSAFSPDIYPLGYAEMVGHQYSSHPEKPNYEDQYRVK